MAITEVNQDNFKAEVLEHPGLVLVDFWAPWCGPCQMLGPIIEEISVEMNGSLKVAKVNADSSPDLITKYNISGIPAVIIFRHGQIKETIIGFHQKKDYLDALK